MGDIEPPAPPTPPALPTPPAPPTPPVSATPEPPPAPSALPMPSPSALPMPSPQASRSRRPSRTQVVIAAATIVALLIGATVAVVLISRHGTSTPTGSSTSPAPVSTGGITNETQLLAAIRTQGLTPTRAEQLFVLDVGPLPGVSVRGITPANGFDGTGALMDLYAEWDHLTKAQQNAATRLMTASHTQKSGSSTTARTMPGPGAATSGSSPTAAAPTRRARLVAQLTGTPAFDYLALAEQANTQEAAATNTGAIAAFQIDVSEAIAKPYAEASLFHLNFFNKWEQWSDGCHITVWDLKFQGLDADSAAAIMAHEVFHCFQQSRAGSGPNVVSLSAWISEGEATWVMDQLHPNAPIMTPKWSLYAFTPTTKYVDRSYDALGVYGHRGDVVGDQTMVWLQLLPIVSAGIGGHDSAAFSLLMGSSSEKFYNSWGPSYFEDQSQGDWHMAGPGTPPAAGPSPQSVTINNGDGQDIGLLGPYQAAQVTITSDADLLMVILASGYGELHDQPYAVQKTLDNSAPLALCLKQGGCKCPDGSPGASEFTTQATGPISVGLDGGDTSLAAYAAAESLDKWCKKPDPPQPPGTPPPPGNGGGGGGGGGGEPEPLPPPPGVSEGDPHLLTFDDRAYDLQAAGEFTLVKSTVDDLLVQAREVPLPGSFPVAVNSAVAARLGGHRVTLTLENSVLVARVDGVADNNGGVTNVGTGTVERLGTDAGTGFVLDWPDGTTVRVDELGVVGLNVTIKPAAARAGTLVGLLGNDNGQAGDDFATADGTSLGTSPTAETVHKQFADSWRITQGQSLFDYRPGQTTATFTNHSFPSSFVNGSNIPGAATAKQECQADGVTDPYLLADCIVDVTAVHSPAVISHYAQAQIVTTVQNNLAHNLPAFAPATTPGGPTPATSPTPNLQGVLIDSGRVNSPAEVQVFTFTAQAGDILWIDQPGCDDGGLAFALIDPQGTTLNADQVSLELSGCGIGRIAAPTTGTYQLVANVDKQRTGSYAVPIRYERHDVIRQTSYGQTLSGSIPDQATHDVYQFSAQAGDVVHVFGSGCNVGGPNSILGFEDATGKPSGPALDCNANSEFVIQTSGTYELTVNFSNVGPFTYSFVIQK